MNISTVTELDVRAIPPQDRHAQIFDKLDALKGDECLQIVNDHDPVPLRLQLESRAPGQYQWVYLQSGPEHWRIQISRMDAGSKAKAEDSCCSGGACCG